MNLVNYVTNTPQNTNKTILKQLVNDEKNKAVYESVEELKRGGQIGYVESNLQKVVIDPNKDYSDAPTAMDGQLIKVSDLSPKADEIIGGTISSDGDGTDEKIEETITSEFIGTSNPVINAFGNGYAIFDNILVFTEANEGSGFETGMYVAAEYLQGFPAPVYIKWGTETIHPINPKYIPGAVLPVVEISTPPLSEGAPLTDEESAAIQAAYDTGMPCVAQINPQYGEGEMVKVSFLMTRIQASASYARQDTYVLEVNGVRYSISKMDGVWLFFAVSM